MMVEEGQSHLSSGIQVWSLLPASLLRLVGIQVGVSLKILPGKGWGEPGRGQTEQLVPQLAAVSWLPVGLDIPETTCQRDSPPPQEPFQDGNAQISPLDACCLLPQDDQVGPPPLHPGSQGDTEAEATEGKAGQGVGCAEGADV